MLCVVRNVRSLCVCNVGMREATAAYQVWKEAKNKRDEKELEKSEKKPPPYRHIKVLCVCQRYRYLTT